MRDDRDMDGFPIDKTYLECDLPNFLQDSLIKYKLGEEKQKLNIPCFDYDINFGQLQSDINSAEIEQLISSESAWYLREKYLGIIKE